MWVRGGVLGLPCHPGMRNNLAVGEERWWFYEFMNKLHYT